MDFFSQQSDFIGSTYVGYNNMFFLYLFLIVFEVIIIFLNKNQVPAFRLCGVTKRNVIVRSLDDFLGLELPITEVHANTNAVTSFGGGCTRQKQPLDGWGRLVT